METQKTSQEIFPQEVRDWMKKEAEADPEVHETVLLMLKALEASEQRVKELEEKATVYKNEMDRLFFDETFEMKSGKRPLDRKNVLVYIPERKMWFQAAWYEDKSMFQSNYYEVSMLEITHWKYLPQPPK